MRTLRQPGPPPVDRIESALAHGRALHYDLEPGLTLNEALTRPLVTAGLRSGAAVFGGAMLSAFHYVLPGPPRDDAHVAWFSEPHACPSARVEVANATLGWRDGAPFVHCHAVWTEPDGSRRAGHILPDKTVVSAGAVVKGWGVADAVVIAEPDAETNFSLFHPVPVRGTAEGTPFILARIRPNQDIGTALAAVCHRHGIARAVTRGGVGSLICPRFVGGIAVADYATEVLVRRADVSSARADIEMMVADMHGQVHEGRLEPGENPVCITFEVMLEPAH